MAVRGAFELMPTPPAIYGDGSPNPNAPFQREFIQLSDLISEAASKVCFTNSLPKPICYP